MKKQDDKILSMLLVILAWLLALAFLVWVIFKIKWLYGLSYILKRITF
ncbi:hypothetical protein [Terrimonas pollutisoli]|nr:hypothetical protein [Terrimonas sp. H1YJ31]